ncbi:hypothetical protein [Sorangium sp. So ce861]|uniref:hypothetical protein n=1 Tax=Sorangium sp. So ce861 TaxID=3133323 RepID=UPI003F5FE0BC
MAHARSELTVAWLARRQFIPFPGAGEEAAREVEAGGDAGRLETVRKKTHSGTGTSSITQKTGD